MKYSQDQIKNKFMKSQCLECDKGKLIHTITDGWISYYLCLNCKTKYEFQGSDNGQTLPFLESK
jgi:uncharacterized protein (DUF983 family)